METRYETQLITTDAGLRALAPEWRELHAAAERRNPFLSPEWTLACRAHHCPDTEPWVLATRLGGRLVGIAPLRREREAGFRVLRFLGDGRSDYLGFLLGPQPAAVQEALVNALQERRAEWDLAVLRQLAEPYSHLAQIDPPSTLRACETEGTVAPHVIFPGHWELLLQAGPGWLKRMQKASRKWIKDGGSVERIAGAAAAQYVEQVAEIEAASWKGEEGVARFQPTAGQELLRTSLLPNLLKNIELNRHNFENFRLFEIGREIHKREGSLPEEIPSCAVVLYAKDGDGKAGLFELKRVAGVLMPGCEARPAEARVFEHPHRSASIWWQGEELGRLFEFHPSHVEAGRAQVLYLNLVKMLAAQPGVQKYVPLRRFPTSDFDITVSVAPRSRVADVLAKVSATAVDNLVNVSYLYEYLDEAKGTKSLSFRFTLGAPDRTLTSDEITKAQEKLRGALQAT